MTANMLYATHFVKESILSFIGSLYAKNASSYWRMDRSFGKFYIVLFPQFTLDGRHEESEDKEEEEKEKGSFGNVSRVIQVPLWNIYLYQNLDVVLYYSWP